MEAPLESAADEVTRLRRCLNDLLGIMALPALWAGGEPLRIVSTLLDVLLERLELDLVFLRFTDPESGRSTEMVRVAGSSDGTARAPEIGEAIDASLGHAPLSWPPRARVYIGGIDLSVASARLGLQGEIGIVVAGSRRRDFPAETERLLLDVAANQAAIGVQQARRLNQQERLTSDLDARVARRTSELAAANELLRREVADLLIDIDERKRVEEALRDSEREARLIVDSIPGLVALLTPTGDVEVVNRQLIDYFGQTIEELRQWGTNDTIHPDDLPHVIDVFSRSIATGNPYDIVQRFKRSDGLYRWFSNRGFPVRDSSGQVVRWCVLLTDIEERKRAEDAVRANESNLKLIIDTIPALAWSARADGSAEFFNQHYLDFVGLSAEEARGWGWAKAVHPEDINGLAATWQRIMASEAPGEAVARLRRHDGVYRWFLFRTNPLRDQSGTIVKWYGINTDIEDRKQVEDALRELQVTMSRATQVATVAELAASIAHEVNQPLSGIITNAGTCLRMLDASPPNIDGARETARRTIRDGNRASDVVARLRALFRKKEFTLEPLDLNDVTREVIAVSSGDLQRYRVVVQSELADDLPWITGDRVQLQQVILNLLRNASDAMAGIDDRPRQLLIRTVREEGDRVRLSVQDTGMGLDRQSLDKLFDAFYTTKRDGMGIGLSVSRSIVERHHGRLWAEPNEGPGATFSFSIPSNAETVSTTRNDGIDTKV